jgi:hypothetical protein
VGRHWSVVQLVDSVGLDRQHRCSMGLTNAQNGPTHGRRVFLGNFGEEIISHLFNPKLGVISGVTTRIQNLVRTFPH